jgi:hypothetical protein
MSDPNIVTAIDNLASEVGKINSNLLSILILMSAALLVYGLCGLLRKNG